MRSRRNLLPSNVFLAMRATFCKDPVIYKLYNNPADFANLITSLLILLRVLHCNRRSECQRFTSETRAAIALDRPFTTDALPKETIMTRTEPRITREPDGLGGSGAPRWRGIKRDYTDA